MIRALLLHLITALCAVILRDVWIDCTAKVFVWRRRRESHREAQKQRELRALAAELMAAEKAAEQHKNRKRQARLIAALPYPQMFGGPLTIQAKCDQDFIEITKALHGNFLAQGKSIVDASFEEN